MRKECNGLYLCEVPTGIGKSYQAAHAMEEYVKEIREEYAKAMRQCARTITDERKLIYLTPLRKNVGEEEEELKKAYENEELFEKEVLHIKSNVDNIIENLGKVTIPQDKQPFNYDELKKQVKAYNGEPSPEIKKIWEDKVEEEERKFRKEIKNILSVIPARERLDRIKNDKQYQWIGQLYPVVFIKEKKIILMTISKFLSKNISLVDKSVTFFDSDISKNAVIFMDEFDSTKEFVRNHIIQNSFKSNDDYHFDIYQIKQKAEGKKYISQEVLDNVSEEQYITAVQWIYENTALVLLEKDKISTYAFKKKMRERFPDITVCQIKGLFDEKVREKYFGEGDIQLARLLFNSLRPYKSEIFHRNNIMGKLFYQSPKWKSKDTVYFVQIHLDYSFHLILKVVTFTKDTGDSGGYVFDKSTGNFRRALKTDKGTKYVKKNKNTKSTVPFLNIENMEKFEASKMGVLKQFVEDVRTYLRDYIEINFETMEEMMSHDKKWEKYSIKVKENKSKIYEKEAAKRLSSHKIAIVDECNTETSKKIADDFQAFLKKVYGVGSKLGDSVSSGTYNLRIIHDKGYYKGENDLHDEIFNKCIVQHITVENYKKCDLEKNPEFYAIIQELFIKEDIVNKQLTTFNWSETLGKSGKTWAFVSFKKDDTDKNTKKKDQYTYYRVFIAPDGKLSFDSCAGRSWMRRKDEWKNIIGYHQELIDKRKSEKRYDENIEGFFYTDINDICTIYKTNACVYPRFDDIEAELLLLKADKELDKEQMIDALLHFKEDSPELVKKNKEDFEKFLNNLKNKEEEYVDKKAFYKDIGRGKLREGFNEYLRAEYRILLNFSKSKENLPLYDLDAMTDIHYSISGDSSGELVKYFVGSAKALNGSVARSNPIRKIIGKTLKAEEILPMLTATFVRNEQYTVIPFPYKYIREYFQVS